METVKHDSALITEHVSERSGSGKWSGAARKSGERERGLKKYGGAGGRAGATQWEQNLERNEWAESAAHNPLKPNNN